MKIPEEIIIGAIAYAILFLVVFTPFCTQAQEAPCRSEGDRVSCQKASFDVLVQKLVKSDGDLKICKIERDSAKADAAESKGALDACIKNTPPPCPEPKKPSAWKSVTPVVAGILGGAILTASVASDSSAGTRTTGAVIGLGLLSAGIVFSLP